MSSRELICCYDGYWQRFNHLVGVSFLSYSGKIQRQLDPVLHGYPMISAERNEDSILKLLVASVFTIILQTVSRAPYPCFLLLEVVIFVFCKAILLPEEH